MNASIPSDDLQGTRTGLPEPIAQLLMAPFQARTYGNLVYLLLSFPLGGFHFVFLATGLSLALLEALNDIGASEYLGVRTLTVSVFTTWLNRGSLPGAAQIACAMLVIVIGLLLV